MAASARRRFGVIVVTVVAIAVVGAGARWLLVRDGSGGAGRASVKVRAEPTTSTVVAPLPRPDVSGAPMPLLADPCGPETKTSSDPLDLGRTGMIVSGGNVQGFLQQTFPDSFAGLVASSPDGGDYTISIVGSPDPIRAALEGRFHVPEVTGPLPCVTYREALYPYATLQNAAAQLGEALSAQGLTQVLVGFGPDQATDTLSVSVLPGSHVDVAALEHRLGVPITVQYMSRPELGVAAG